MTRFIVHIGPHKTGTTYLQVMLDALRPALLEQGICVPSIWNAAPGLPSHLKLVSALRNRAIDYVSNQVKALVDESHRVVIISSEDLSRLTKDEVIQLGGLLGSKATRVVYYVRRWPETLPSLWQEMVKHGRSLTFPEFLISQFTDYNGFAARDVAVLDTYSSVFGAHNIRIVPYSRIVDDGHDIAVHFLNSFLGLPSVEISDSRRLNVSLSIFDVELIRALNTLHALQGGKPTTAFRVWYINVKERLSLEPIVRAMQGSVSTIRLNEGEPPIFLSVQEILRRYGSSIVPPGNAQNLHELRSVDVPYVSQEYLLDPSVLKLVREVYEACRASLVATTT